MGCRGVMHITDVKSLTVQGPTDALPWEIRSAGAGADPSGAAGPGGSALQPWGDNAGASATGASGHERSGNAEITPLEVRSYHCLQNQLLQDLTQTETPHLRPQLFLSSNLKRSAWHRQFSTGSDTNISCTQCMLCQPQHSDTIAHDCIP